MELFLTGMVFNIPHRREIAILLALVAFCTCTVARDLSRGDHANEWSRMVTTLAIVQHGTFAINDYAPQSQTLDWARFEGSYYSNKAPGPAVLATPGYLLQYLAEAALGVTHDDWGAFSRAVYFARLITTTIPTLFALLLLFVVLIRRFDLPPRPALLVCAAWGLGSLGFLYSSVYFGHQTAAAFFAISFCCALLDERRLFWPGLALGVAVACDNNCVFPAAAFVGWLIWSRRQDAERWSLGRDFLLGGAIPAALILVYNRACFGGFLTTQYSPGIGNAEFEQLVKLGSPDLSRLADVTVRPWRGLFYCTPVWALVLVGLDPIRKLARERTVLWAAAAATLGFFFYLSMLPSAFGGWCIGPRYFVCVLPLAALLLIHPARELPRLFSFLLALSVLMMLVAVLVDPIAPQNFRDPFQEYLFPILERDRAAPMTNAFTWLFGFSRMEALGAYALICLGTWGWLDRRLSTRHAKASVAPGVSASPLASEPEQLPGV